MLPPPPPRPHRDRSLGAVPGTAGTPQDLQSWRRRAATGPPRRTESPPAPVYGAALTKLHRERRTQGGSASGSLDCAAPSEERMERSPSIFTGMSCSLHCLGVAPAGCLPPRDFFFFLPWDLTEAAGQVDQVVHM